MWVNLLADSDASKVDVYELIDEMTDFYETRQELKEEMRGKMTGVSIGDYVAVKSEVDGKTSWLRGRVVGTDTESVQ